MRYVIIGASAAGISCAKTIQKKDPLAKITIICQEKAPAYNKCLLVDVIAQIIPKHKIVLLPDGTQSAGISVYYEHTVNTIDHTKKEIITTNGSAFGYDRLFMGTGVRARPLSVPGRHAQGIFHFHTLHDIEIIEQWLNRKSITHAVIIGAGLTGIECADALYKCGIAVTIIDRNSHILPFVQDKNAIAFLEQHLVQKNIILKREHHVNGFNFNHDQEVTGVIANDTFFPAQLVIIAIGSIANSHIAQEAGIATNMGYIVTNHYLQTSVADIWAGGDVVQTFKADTGQPIVSTTWPDAIEQGRIAALNMTGFITPYAGITPGATSQFFDLHVAVKGHLCLDQTCCKHFIDATSSYYLAIFYQDHLKGFIVIANHLRLASFLTHALKKSEKSDQSFFNMLEALKGA